MPPSIFEAVSTGGSYQTVKYGDVAVPIYRDAPAGKTRYRVSYRENGIRHFKSFRKLQLAKTFALKTAKLIHASGRSATNIAVQISPVDAALFVRASEIAKLAGRSVIVTVEEAVSATTLIQSICENPPSLLEVAREWAENYRIYNNITPQTVESLVPAYVAELVLYYERDNLPESSLKRRRAEARRFLKAFGSRLIHTISATELKEWYASRVKKRRIIDATYNQYLATLADFFNWARDEARALPLEIPTSVDHVSRIFRRGRPTPHNVEIYSPDSVRGILEHIDSRWLAVAVIWLFTGIRFSEIRRLCWRDVDLADGAINCDRSITKTMADRYVYLAPCAIAWLETIGETMHPDSPLVAFKSTGVRYASETTERNAFHQAFKSALKAAGVDFIKNGLRHAYASHMYILTRNSDFVAEQMGNTHGVLWTYYIRRVKIAEAVHYFSIFPDADDPRKGIKHSDWLPNEAFRPSERPRRLRAA